MLSLSKLASSVSAGDDHEHADNTAAAFKNSNNTAPTTAIIPVRWWQSLLDGKLVWYPNDSETGFRLDQKCAFECPRRHFSHLLQLYDLEEVQMTVIGEEKEEENLEDAEKVPPLSALAVNGSPSPADVNRLITLSIDNWYRVTCNESNWFNEECRGFTQCGLVAMNTVAGRPAAAQGNLTNCVDTVITPNAMYGEMVRFGGGRVAGLMIW